MNNTMHSTNLSHLVSRICNGNYKESELIDFVSLIQKISLSYLKYQEVIGKHIRWERKNHSGELEDLALDCVAGLFMRNDNGDFIQLKKYFQNNVDDIQKLESVEIMVLLRRLVIKKTKQELSRIFKERDPEGAKIVRNIKVAIKSASDFSSFKEMGREYIFLNNLNGNGTLNGFNGKKNGEHLVPPSSKIQEHSCKNEKSRVNPGYLRKNQPSIPERILRGEYLNAFCPKDPVSAGIRKMLMVVKNDDRYQNYLPVDMIARIMRHTNMEMARDRLSTHVPGPSPLDELKLKEIEKRKIAVLKRIKSKIQNQYVKTKKISEQRGMVYYKALSDILDDISHGKKYDSYFRHLKRYMPGLTQRHYRSHERTIFEYLGKLIKKWFRESLMELL